ncbi:MAG: histidine kinase [Bacteroidota bacterium]
MLTPYLPFYAQEQPLFFYSYTTEDGLISNSKNIYFSRDSEGNIWISNLNGLVRFDGYKFHIYQPQQENPRAISQIQVQSQLFEDQDGRLWFNTKTNLEYYDPLEKGFFQVPVANKTGVEEDFHVFHMDSATHTLWFVGKKVNQYPLYVLETTPPFQARCVDSIPSYFPRGGMGMKAFKENPLYLFLTKLNGWEFREYSHEEGQWSRKAVPQIFELPYQPFCFYPQSPDSILIGTSEGLFLAHPNTTELSSINRELLNIKGIFPYDEKHWLVGIKSDSIFLLNRKEPENPILVRSYGARLGKSEGGAIRTMYLDEGRNLWIATESKGIFMHPMYRKKFEALFQDQISIKGVAEDHMGSYWFLSPRGLIHSDQDGNTIDLSPNDSLLSKKVFTNAGFHLENDLEGNLWLSTTRGLYVRSRENNEFEKVVSLHPTNERNLVFTDFLQLRSGERMGVTHGAGLLPIMKIDDKYVFDSSHPITANGKYIFAFENAHRDILANLWPEGIVIFRRGKDRWEVLPDTLPYHAMIYGMTEDPQRGITWMGGQDGLYEISQSNGKYQIRKDEAFSTRFQTVNSLKFDSEGSLWISTGKGLVRYTPSHTARKQTPIPQSNGDHFDQSFGLPANGFYPRSICSTKSGEFLIGSTQGLARFDPLTIEETPFQGKPFIAQIKINNYRSTEKHPEEWVKYLGTSIPKLYLHDSVRTLEVIFLSNEEYGDKYTLQYQYILRSSDGEVLSTQEENLVRFMNLNPGEYILEMYATNSQKQWGKPIYLGFEMLPHWSSTFWFRSLIFLSLLVIVILVYRNRIRLAKNAQEIAESRQRIAEFRLREVEIVSAIKRLQMNPHFIFNSLNSIRAYIMDENIEVAEDFLLRFAELIRRILDIADRPYITLQEEKDFLEQYMSVEALRFNHRFDYEFEIPDDLDLYEVVIPTMILQPFVENTILHGFKSRTFQGLIKVTFYIQGEYLHCIVRDNGIGRRKENSLHTHHSKAIDITQKRLQLIKDKTGKEANLAIIDHEDPSGTEIRLLIPML